jgi:hypothetical protein
MTAESRNNLTRQNVHCLATARQTHVPVTTDTHNTTDKRSKMVFQFQSATGYKRTRDTFAE